MHSCFDLFVCLSSCTISSLLRPVQFNAENTGKKTLGFFSFDKTPHVIDVIISSRSLSSEKNISVCRKGPRVTWVIAVKMAVDYQRHCVS